MLNSSNQPYSLQKEDVDFSIMCNEFNLGYHDDVIKGFASKCSVGFQGFFMHFKCTDLL